MRRQGLQALSLIRSIVTKKDCSHEEYTTNGAAERQGTQGGAERERGFPRKPDPGRCRQCHFRVGWQRRREDHEQDEDRVPGDAREGHRGGIPRLPRGRREGEQGRLPERVLQPEDTFRLRRLRDPDTACEICRLLVGEVQGDVGDALQDRHVHLRVLCLPPGDQEVDLHLQRNREPEREAQARDAQAHPGEQRGQCDHHHGERVPQLRQVGGDEIQEGADGGEPGRAEEDGIRNLSRGGISSCPWTGRREIRQAAAIHCLHKLLTALLL